jgi:hypothetical protein
MSFNDEVYKQKYLKYKAKYLELKEQEGGIGYGYGDYIFFYDTTKYVLKAQDYLPSSLDDFTNKIGNEAWYYKMSDKNLNNKNFLIHKNRSNVQIAKDRATKAAQDAKAIAAKAACSFLDLGYYTCKIEEMTDVNTIEVGIEFKEINTHSTTFKERATEIIKKINEKTKTNNEKFGAILISAGLSNKILQLYLPN